MKCLRSCRLPASVFAIILTSIQSNHALSQPAGTIRFVVPYAAGGPNDSLARLLGEQIGRAHGTSVIVEDRPGGSTVVGTEAVLRAPADGNTLLIISADLVITPHLRKLNYDPLSLEPICYLVTSPVVITVNSTSPYRTLAELLEAARAKPGEVTMASTPASAFHIAIERLKRTAQVNMTFVPFAGGAPAVTALLGGHVTSMLSSYQTAAEQLRAGKLRALATATATRAEALPDVPTAQESGYKQYEADVWYGVVAPPKTPKQTLSQLSDWFSAALSVPEVRARLVVQGFYPVGICGEEFRQYLRKQYDDYGRITREANIKAE